MKINCISRRMQIPTCQAKGVHYCPGFFYILLYKMLKIKRIGLMHIKI